MSLTEIIKSQPYFQKIVEKKNEGLLTNATMFFCEDEETSHMVLILCSLLLEYQTFDLMNEKSSEFKRISSGADLDVKIFPKGEKLLVSDANEIVLDSLVKPVNLPNKIYLIKNIDVSTDEAQNKLLKVLEEPPKNVYFFLSAKSEEKVLPTIKSRCDKIKIVPFKKEEIEKFCSNKLAVILGEGYLGKTLSLEKLDELSEIVKLGVSLVCELKNSKQVLKFSQKVLDFRMYLDLILQTVTLCLEDILKIKCESEKLCKLKSYVEDLKEIETEYSVRAVCEICSLISQFRKKLEFNANLTVAVDNLLLKILEVKYLCK